MLTQYQAYYKEISYLICAEDVWWFDGLHWWFLYYGEISVTCFKKSDTRVIKWIL